MSALECWLRAEVSGAGATLGFFVRAYGVLLAGFAYYTLPGYLQMLERTVISFHYFPFHHLPLGPMTPDGLWSMRASFLVCSCCCALGVAARSCFAASSALMLYVMQLRQPKDPREMRRPPPSTAAPT